MDNKTLWYILIILMVTVSLFYYSKISSIKEDLLVEGMTEICEEDYNASYQSHDSIYFYCLRGGESIRVQFTG